MKKINTLTLAFSIALLPPIWAVLSPYLGVTTGAVALICAGLYATNKNNKDDAIKMCIGFLCGDLWSVIAIYVMEMLPFNPNVELYCTLFVLGGLAVIIGETFNSFIFTPAWLCGWAIGLTIMGPMKIAELGSLPIQIGVAMLAGVLYVGFIGDAFQKFLIKKFTK